MFTDDPGRFALILAAVVGALVGAVIGWTISFALALVAMMIIPLQDTPPDYVLLGTPIGFVVGPVLAILIVRRRRRRGDSP